MLVGQKRWPEAIRYYLCGLTIRPDVSGIWRGLGVAFRHTGELPRSRDALRRALELQPDNPPILIDLVETLLAQRDFAAAESAARDAVRLAPESAAGYGILGRTQMEKGSLTDALKSLERCLELTAQRPDPRLTPQIWIDECRRRLNATNPPNPPPSKEFLP
jgi:cytochrome c-type biogenesis protein CcmH/NrfG